MTSLSSINHATDDALHFSINSSFDALAVEILRPKLDELAIGECDVVMDLNNVDFIDSSGIGAIVFLFKRLRAVKRDLTIIGAHGQPLELMKHLRVDKTITVKA